MSCGIDDRNVQRSAVAVAHVVNFITALCIRVFENYGGGWGREKGGGIRTLLRPGGHRRVYHRRAVGIQRSASEISPRWDAFRRNSGLDRSCRRGKRQTTSVDHAGDAQIAIYVWPDRRIQTHKDEAIAIINSGPPDADRITHQLRRI